MIEKLHNCRKFVGDRGLPAPDIGIGLKPAR